MQVITNLNFFTKPLHAIVTQGTFDGVHAGHRQILSNIVALAKKKKGKSILVTFDPHPRQVLFKDENSIRLLTPLNEKIEIFREIGLDYLIVLPFDDSFSKMTAPNFVRDILVEKIGVSTIVVGHDHRFGQNREGTFDDLKDYAEIYGFEVIEIGAHDINEAVVSSTKIRKSLLAGDIHTANLFLARHYSVTGKVVHGKKLGATLGFPTANIEVNDKAKLIPANGVYAALVNIDNLTYKAMLNIGNSPTINNASWSFEVHIIDFDKNIYGETLTVYFVERLRDEIKFDSLDNLILQIKKDEIKVKLILNSCDIN